MEQDKPTKTLEYPDWLYRQLVEDSFPWEQGVRMHFNRFTEKHTLHDSYWIGIFYDVAFSAEVTLAIQWDFVWLPNDIKQHILSVSDTEEWPYLFIRLTEVEQVSTNKFCSLDRICRTIGDCEFEEIEGKKVLAFDDVLGGQVTIVYRGEETFLALGEHRQIIPIVGH